MRRLNVWLEASAEPIGELISTDDGAMRFTYAPNWLVDQNSHPLSLSLPFQEDAFGDAVTRAYFNNLLQENDQLAGC